MITVEQIESTETYKNANSVQQLLMVKKANREIINNAVIVHKNTGVINKGINGIYRDLLNELIVEGNEKNLSYVNKFHRN